VSGPGRIPVRSHRSGDGEAELHSASQELPPRWGETDGGINRIGGTGLPLTGS
jgi:hypothetical protein